MFMFSRSGKIIPVARNSSVEVKENALYDYTEPIKGHGGGGGFFFFWGGGIFVKKKCVPSSVHRKPFAFSHKTS